MTLDELIDQAVELRDTFGGAIEVKLKVPGDRNYDPVTRYAESMKVRVEETRYIEISSQ